MKKLFLILLSTGCFLAVSSPLHAFLFYDTNGTATGFGNPGSGNWPGTSGWNSSDSHWYGGNFATINDYDGTNATVTYATAAGNTTNDIVVFNGGGLGGSSVRYNESFTNVAGIIATNFTSEFTLNKTGANKTLGFAAGAAFQTDTATRLSGIAITTDYTKTGAANLSLASNALSGEEYNGTVTVAQGQLAVLSVFNTGANSNVNLTGGTFSIRISGDAGVNIGNLSGTSGDVTVNNFGPVANKMLTVNQTTSATYSGTISQTIPSQQLGLTKQGAATLTLDGSSIQLDNGLVINQGAVLINSASTAIRNAPNPGVALAVNSGGTLGGNGTITISGNPDNVVVASGGMLSPGDAGVGTLDFVLNAARSLDISGAVSGANTGSLVFDLAATADMVALSSGILTIGDGALEWDDFDFTVLSGLAAGDYTLFDTTVAIDGTLGTTLSGALGDDFIGMLSFANSNQDLLLTVTAVPEPSTGGLILGGLLLGGLLRRSRRRRSS